MTDTFLVVNPTKDGKFEVWFEPAPVAAAGDLPGHPFRGNQWTDAIRSEDVTTGWGPPAQTAVDERFTAAADVKSGWVSGYYRGPDDAFLARHNLDRQSYDQLYHDAFTGSKVRDAEELAANNRWHEVMQDFYQQGGREYPYTRDENGEWQSTTRYGVHPWDVPGWVKDDGQVDPARLQESVTNLSAYVRAGELAVQVPAGKLDDILADGRLRSASEVSNHWSTGKDPDSPGDRVTGYATARREVERDYIGVEKGTPRAERPIYGYITGDGSSVYYGNATIYLRDTVRDRASVTAGDSLDGRLIPQSLRSVERGDFDPRLNMKTALVPGQGRYTPDGAAEWTQDAVPPMYVEAQIAGGVRLSDIARIEIRQTADYRETAMTQQVQGADTLDRLRAAGIEVTVSTAPNFGTRTGAVARQDVEPLPAVVAAITHRVLAHRADQLLVDVGDGVGVIEINGTAVTPPTALITLLAQPYWEPVERTGIIAGGRIELGEGPGHPFRGNQHTGGIPADEDPSAPGRQITGYHTTDPESVETILRDGFDPLAPRRYGSLYGKGIYFHLDTPTGRAAQAQMWGERFKATITTHNPFLLDQKEIAKFDVSKGSIKEQIASKLGVLDRFNELKDDKAKTQPFVRVDVRAGHALRQAAMEAGYDAIIVRGSHGSDTLAHDQIVVFSADQVKIVGQEEAIYTQPVDLAADDMSRPMVLLSVPAFLMNLENQKRARASLAVVQLLELGDVEGHPFHGNQWTARSDEELKDIWVTPGPTEQKLTKEEVNRLGQLVKEQGTPSSEPLYRGMAVADLSAVRARFVPGEVIDLPASSFDSNENHASRYAMENPWHTGRHPVLIEVPAGTKAMRITSPYPGENESIVAGRFHVESVEEQTGKWRAGPFTETRDWLGLVVKLTPVALTSAVQPLELGDLPGHPFRGNQWTGGQGDGGMPNADTTLRDELLDSLREKKQALIEDLAAENLMTVPEYEAAVHDHLKELFSEAEVKMRVTPEILEQILNDGMIKNQHEVGTSGPGGGYAPDLRIIIEDALHGDVADRDRPKYGYLEDTSMWSDMDAYGDVELTFRNDVRDRTTVTLGDSADELGVRPAVMLGMPEQLLSAATPLENPDVMLMREGDLLQANDLQDLLNSTGAYGEEYASYIEAQIHGPLAASDIADVNFLEDTPSPELEALLKEKGISYG